MPRPLALLWLASLPFTVAACGLVPLGEHPTPSPSPTTRCEGDLVDGAENLPANATPPRHLAGGTVRLARVTEADGRLVAHLETDHADHVEARVGDRVKVGTAKFRVTRVCIVDHAPAVPGTFTGGASLHR